RSTCRGAISAGASRLGVGTDMPSFRPLAALLLLSACQSKTHDEAAPAPTAPWAAPRPQTSTEAKERAGATTTRYTLEPSSQLRGGVPAKEAEPSGVFRVVRGTLDVDLRELSNTRGVIEIDLGSLVMSGRATSAESDDTQRAHDWLGLGDARPASELER